MSKIVLTRLNQAVFHLENGEYIVFFFKGGDGYLKKIGNNYRVIVRSKYDNRCCYVCDEIGDIRSAIGSIIDKGATLIVCPSARFYIVPHSGLRMIVNLVMGVFIRKTDVFRDVFGEGYAVSKQEIPYTARAIRQRLMQKSLPGVE